MDSAAWSAVAAAAAAVSALISAIAAAVTLSQVVHQKRNAEFSNCLLLLERLAEAQRRIRDAKDEPVRIFEFREYLNLLEGLAGLVNRNQLMGATRQFTEDFLKEAWAWLKANPTQFGTIEGSITGEGTFAELMKFAEHRSGSIDDLVELYRARIADAATTSET